MFAGSISRPHHLPTHVLADTFEALANENYAVLCVLSRREWLTSQSASTWSVWCAMSWNAGTRSRVSAVVTTLHHRPAPVVVLRPRQRQSLHRYNAYTGPYLGNSWGFSRTLNSKCNTNLKCVVQSIAFSSFHHVIPSALCQLHAPVTFHVSKNCRSLKGYTPNPLWWLWSLPGPSPGLQPCTGV